jgi:hypothetical protein
MAETIFESPESLKEHINFSNKTKGIIWKTILDTWSRLQSKKML